MIGGVLVCHVDLAGAFFESLEQIRGPVELFEVVPLVESYDQKSGSELVEYLRDELSGCFDRLYERKSYGVIVFSDMFGGSPTNAAISLLDQEGLTDNIAGVNLPMLNEFLRTRNKLSVQECAEACRDVGRSQIILCNELLQKTTTSQFSKPVDADASQLFSNLDEIRNLRHRMEELHDALTEAQFYSGSPGLGHNSRPELMADPEMIPSVISGLRLLESEIEQNPTPSAQIVQVARYLLMHASEALKSTIKWIARHADAFIRAAVVAAGTITGTFWAAQVEIADVLPLLERVIKLIEQALL